MKIVFLNGPPHCGKDSAADRLHLAMPHIVRMKFADPLKDGACGFLGITREELERIKDEPHPALNGNTPRSFLINLSENLIKPSYGKAFFGNVANGKLAKLPNDSVVFFSDSGFVEEAEPIIETFGLHACYKVEIEREGKTFNGDSRSYWKHPGLHTVVIKNDRTITTLADRIYRAVF